MFNILVSSSMPAGERGGRDFQGKLCQWIPVSRAVWRLRGMSVNEGNLRSCCYTLQMRRLHSRSCTSHPDLGISVPNPAGCESRAAAQCGCRGLTSLWIPGECRIRRGSRCTLWRRWDRQLSARALIVELTSHCVTQVNKSRRFGFLAEAFIPRALCLL